MRKIICLLLFVYFISVGLAQAGEVVLKDNFSDGNLTSNPTWQAVSGANRFTVVNDNGRKAIRTSELSFIGSLFKVPANTGRPVVLDSKQGPISAKFDLRFESTVNGNIMVVYLMGPEGFVAVDFFQGRRVQLLFYQRTGKNRELFVSKKAYSYDPKRYYSCELIGYPDRSFEVLIDGKSVMRETPKNPVTRFNVLGIRDRAFPNQGHLITNIVVSGEPFKVAGLKAPSGFVPDRTSRRTLIAYGLFSECYGINEALQLLGRRDKTEAYLRTVTMGQNIIEGFPRNVEGIFRYDLIILANVDSYALGEKVCQGLRSFVERGGGLVILGGFYSFGQGGYYQSRLSEVLPVVPVGKGWDLDSNLPDNTIRLKTTYPINHNIAWSPSLSAYYINRFQARPKSKVLATVSGQPVIVLGKFGKGRVVAIGLTPLGRAVKGQELFWKSPQWSKLLADLLRWVAQ